MSAAQPVLQPSKCANCAAEAPGHFCSNCGQKTGHINLTLRVVLGDFAQNVLQLDAKLLQTLKALFARPGQLTRDYWEGRRARHLAPFQLYALTSAVYFLGLWLTLSDAAESAGAAATLAREDKTAANEAAQAWGGVKLSADDTPAESRMEQRVNDRLAFWARKGPTEFSHVALSRMSDDLSKIQFLLVPLYALWLRLIFRKAGQHYPAHFVLVLHLQSRILLLATVSLAASEVAGEAISLLTNAAVIVASAGYSIADFRALFGLHWPRATVSFLVFSFLYLITWGAALAAWAMYVFFRA